MKKTISEIKKIAKQITAYDKGIIDYRKSRSEGVYLGYAAIAFRDKAKPDASAYEYILNGTGDGWFRKVEGNAKGYGLCIIQVKVKSKKGQHYGPKYIVYKAMMKYIPSDKEEEEDAEVHPIWIFVHNDFELEDVLSYIQQNSNKWRP